MKRKITLPAVACAVLLLLSGSQAADRTGYDELTHLMDSALVLEADVFAPGTWEKAQKAFEKARIAVETNKKQKSVDKEVAEAREYTENAVKASEVAKLSLQEYLEPRDKAKAAQADKLVPELWGEAEKQFLKATEKVEKGDVKGGLREAEKSVSLFGTAELEGIREAIVGSADQLIAKAVADEAEKYALAALDKARTARQKASVILDSDRYNNAEASAEASRAEYEARHASNIAQSVRSLNRNDQAWEKLMLVYEIQMNRVGQTIGLKTLPFDNGPLAAADTLINYINNLKAGRATATADQAQLADDVSARMHRTLARLGASATGNDPLNLADILDEKVAILMAERDNLAERAAGAQTQLAELSAEHEVVATELSERTKREEKFKKAKRMLNPSEGEVLFNAANDIVLRLSGLSFDIGKSDIKDGHVPLLEKVKTIVEMFPDAQLVVEGHTDASGDPKSNLTLSEKRAYAVMQYFRQTLLIPADKIQAIGYGADKPIASNQTKDGRAKNRRIDVLIMQ